MEQFEYGITRAWRHNKQLAIIRSQGDMSRSAIDVWSDVVIDTVRNWSAGSPVLLLIDLSHKNQGITPYSMNRVSEMYNQPIPADLQVYIAILFADSLITRIFEGIFRRIGGRRENVHERIFLDSGEALAWVESCLPSEWLS